VQKDPEIARLVFTDVFVGVYRALGDEQHHAGLTIEDTVASKRELGANLTRVRVRSRGASVPVSKHTESTNHRRTDHPLLHLARIAVDCVGAPLSTFHSCRSHGVPRGARAAAAAAGSRRCQRAVGQFPPRHPLPGAVPCGGRRKNAHIEWSETASGVCRLGEPVNNSRVGG